jgi:N-acetyl-anhydromuramyl-L-alanine amidase AmpD
MDAKKIGYHFIIDRDGSLHQTASLSHSVNHAGKAMWNGQSPNRTHLAIAFISWGFLTDESKAWNGTQVAGVKRRGKLWDPASEAQENRLNKLLGELIRFYGISPLNICGHDECAIPQGRKADPGGSLLKTMGDIRKSFAS